MAKFKVDTPVVHIKTGVRGMVTGHEGDKVSYLKDDGTTSTVNATSLQTVSKYEAEQAKAAKKAAKEKAAKEKAKAPARERKAGSKDGYVQSGQLEYDPNRYTTREGALTPSGNKVKDVGDEAAGLLAGLDFDGMVKVVAKETGRNKAEVVAKYEHLNPGMQRMTLSNILRGALRAKAEGIDPTPKAAKAPAKKAAAKAPAKKAAKSKADPAQTEAVA